MRGCLKATQHRRRTGLECLLGFIGVLKLYVFQGANTFHLGVEEAYEDVDPIHDLGLNDPNEGAGSREG